MTLIVSFVTPNSTTYWYSLDHKKFSTHVMIIKAWNWGSHKTINGHCTFYLILILS